MNDNWLKVAVCALLKVWVLEQGAFGGVKVIEGLEEYSLQNVLAKRSGEN